MAQAHLSSRIVTPTGIRAGALLVDRGRILAICSPAEIPAGTERIDHGTDAILPGLVDTHVHINEPGRTEWEGFRTATRAAAAGGFTTLVDMPLNALPATVDLASLEAKRAAAQGKCLVDWASWGGCTETNQADLEPLARAGVPGFKAFLIYPGCEGFTAISLAALRTAAPTLARLGLPLLVHAELEAPIASATSALNRTGADWTLYETYLRSRPDEAELEAIAALIALCREFRFPLHIVHLSTARALPLLAAARAEGLPLTAETCPHYLFFVAEGIPDRSTVHKCAPPIRSRANNAALLQALRDGTLDLVATDHSPCPPAMKLETGRFDRSWGGIASLSVALSALHTLHPDLADLTRWLSAAPATLAGLVSHAGALLPGREASFCIFNPEVTWTVTSADLHFRHPISPYLGHTLRGRVQSTWLRGEPVFTFSPALTFASQPSGHDLTGAAPAANGPQSVLLTHE